MLDQTVCVLKNRSSPSVSISNLNFSYSKQKLFENFNFTLAAGKWTCLLGASGVGKSTLLKLIAGIVESFPTQKLQSELPGHSHRKRESSLQGCNQTFASRHWITAFTGMTPKNVANFQNTIQASDGISLANRIAYMAQQDLLMPWLSLLENVLLGYRLRGEKNFEIKQQHALALLEKAGLAEVSNLRPAQLSCGMRQRAALVRTLLEDRPIVLMDEPFSALDVITQLKLQNLAAQLLTNRTVLLVTHNPLEALRLADYVYVIKGTPIRLSDAIELPNSPPRDPADPALLAQQAALLKLLTEEEK